MNNQPFINLTDHRGPLYLCEWDGGEVTEIHTLETFSACYAETNLFDRSEARWVRGREGYWRTMAGVLAYMDDEPHDRTVWRADNMTIQRIR